MDPDAYGVGDSAACDSGNLSTNFFDRDGNLVLTWPHDRDRSEMAAAFLARTGKPLALQAGSAWREDSPWDVPLTPEEASAGTDLLRRFDYSPGRARCSSLTPRGAGLPSS